MVIDSSAILAILFDEEEAERIEAAIEADGVRLMSGASMLECAIAVEARYGEAGGRELDLLVHKAGIEIASVDPGQIEIARAAHRRWGKGRDPAGLNFGDCFSYALSRVSGERLLFKGADFSKTDVATAAY